MDKILAEICDMEERNDPQDISNLLKLSRHDDEEIRRRALECLQYFHPGTDLVSRMRQGIGDPDPLVRATCVEALGDWEDQNSREKIESLLSDESLYVRCAAITSLGQLGAKKCLAKLKVKYPCMKPQEALATAMALYLNGESELMLDVLGYLKSDDYHLRCAAANLASEFAMEKDLPGVKVAIEKALEIEKSTAVISTYERILTEFSDEAR